MITEVCSLAGTTADELRWSPDTGTEPVEVTPLRPPALAELGELLGLGPAEHVLSRFRFLAGEIQAPPWIISFPDDLAAAVAALDDDGICQVVPSWRAGSSSIRPVSGSVLDSILASLRDLLAGSPGPFAFRATGEVDGG